MYFFIWYMKKSAARAFEIQITKVKLNYQMRIVNNYFYKNKRKQNEFL